MSSVPLASKVSNCSRFSKEILINQEAVTVWFN
jgi:hypothetical protein